MLTNLPGGVFGKSRGTSGRTMAAASAPARAPAGETTWAAAVALTTAALYPADAQTLATVATALISTMDAAPVPAPVPAPATATTAAQEVPAQDSVPVTVISIIPGVNEYEHR
jgi:hypothetical protein